jgi:hypothetical protein
VVLACDLFSSFVIVVRGARKVETDWVRGSEGNLEDELMTSENSLTGVSVRDVFGRWPVAVPGWTSAGPGCLPAVP